MVDLIDKTPPQSLEAEMAVLGLHADRARSAGCKALDLLDENSFYKPAHQQIFRTLAHLFSEGASIDVVTVGERLENHSIS